MVPFQIRIYCIALSIASFFANTQHVEPIRSASKTRLFTGSLDNVRTHTLSTSVPTTPVHTVNPMFSVKTPNGYTSNHVQSSTPTQTSSATNPSFSDMSSAENMNSNTTELKAKRSDGRRFSDSEEQRNRKEPRDVNSTVWTQSVWQPHKIHWERMGAPG